MGWESWFTLIVVLWSLWALARSLAGADVILMGSALLLVSMHLASPLFPSVRDLAASFGNEGVLTIAALYVVAAGLTETGGMTLLTEPLLGRPRSVAGGQARLCFSAAGISAFLNNTPVVALFIPVVEDWCKKTGLPPSKMFLPLSYAALLGGACTLIGTSTNLVVQGMLVTARQADPTLPLFGMFTLTPIGVACAIAGLAFIVAGSRWLLPERTSLRNEIDAGRQYVVEMEVEAAGGIDGLSIERAGLRRLPGSYLSAIERAGETLVAIGPDQVLRARDRLIFAGVVDAVVDLQRIKGLKPATTQVGKLSASRWNRCLVEVVVSETHPVVGTTIRDGRFRTRYDAAVIAVYRDGGRLLGRIGDIVLRPGDALLLQAHDEFAERHRNNRDFLLVSRIEGSRPTRHEKAWVAIAVLAALVVVASLERVTGVGIFHASLAAAALMGLTGCLSASQARRSVDLPIIVAIVAALVVGKAVETTGLASVASAQIVALTRPFGAWGVLAGVYVLTLVLTELVTNNAAAALAFPVALAASHALGVSVLPFAVVVAVAASLGFATPLGYQTHMMVLGPGGYRFSDFARIGIPLDLVCGVIAVTVTPLFYPF